MRLPSPDELSQEDHWRLYRHEVQDYYGELSLSKIRYMAHVHAVRALLRRVPNLASATGRVVDVGCAQGFFSLELAELGHEVVGVDLNGRFIEYARLRDNKRVANFICASGDSLPIKTSCADLVILGEILEHVADPRSFVAEAGRVLKEEGFLIVTTPNGKSLNSSLPSYDNRGDPLELLARQFGPDDADHLFLFRPEELRRVLRDEGFDVDVLAYGKTWLFNRFTFPFVKYARGTTINLIDRVLSVPPLGSVLGDNLFLLAHKNLAHHDERP